MRTILLDRGPQRLYLKVAEEPEDIRRLKKLCSNILLLRVCAPELAPEIIEEWDDRLLFAADSGRTFNSEQAAPVYDSQPWIADSILAQLDKLQAHSFNSGPVLKQRFAFLVHHLMPLSYFATLPWVVQSHLILPLLCYPCWVMTHGDLHTGNVVVDETKKETKLIDWEKLALRPKYYDEFKLAFHRCVPFRETTWERCFLRRRFQDQPLPGIEATHPVALAVMCYYHRKEFERRQTSEKRRIRMAIRYENLLHFANRDNWCNFIGCLLD